MLFERNSSSNRLLLRNLCQIKDGFYHNTITNHSVELNELCIKKFVKMTLWL